MAMSKLSMVACLAVGAMAQDPAEGWMAYAVGSIPSKYERVTHLEMYWKVSANPTSRSSAFYSPWFGMDPADNLNLIQPVNPWLGNGWVGYTEYYQWSPTRNSNSKQIDVKAGQTLHGTLDYVASSDKYVLTQEVVETGAISTQDVTCQSGKKYTLPYIVYEKTWPCKDYPPDGEVNFYNISATCDGEECTKAIQWAAKVKDDNCNMQANIKSNGEISITWDTTASSIYDNHTAVQLYDLNIDDKFTRLGVKRPTDAKPVIQQAIF